MRIGEFREELRAAGARPRHETLALRAWARGLPLDALAQRAESAFPARLKAALPNIAARLAGLARVRAEHPAADGSARLLLALADGRSIESVLLPRDGVCVSTQVGCAVGCVFCMTGREGLLRQLGSAEILAQVALARARRPLRRVVFMGMGEPAHNLDNVLEAIELLGTEGGLGHKNLVFSTVGDRRVFERLPQGPVKPALALSLHTTRPALRARLLPRAPRIDPAELVELGEAYARATGYPIQYQWTLLEGVNDGDDEVDAIAALLAGKYAVMNFIPYNRVDGLPFRRPSWERAAEMARRLHRRGVLAKLRRSAGQDVEGGCGQLRARTLPGRAAPALASLAAALTLLGGCGRQPGAPAPTAAPPAAAPAAAFPAAQPEPAASESRGAQAVARARPYGDVDLARCLKLAADDDSADEPRCPAFVSAAAREALATCRDAGGRLVPRQLAALGSVDVNGDGRSELIFALGDNYDCDGAPSVFSCGSLGCPYGIYEQRGAQWVSIGSVGAEEATGLEVLARRAGQRYAPLRGGCFGEAGCARITYFEWTQDGYQAEYIDAGGYRVDLDPDLAGLLAQVQDVPVRKAPAADGEVLQKYPVGTEMALLGVARDAPYYYVSPCNACETGFIEKAALGPLP